MRVRTDRFSLRLVLRLVLRLELAKLR